MTAREKRIVARLVEEAVRPSAPLPPVDRTDAVAAFDSSLAHAPLPTRLGVRALMVATEIAPGRLAAARSLLRRLAARAYYGDREVMRLLGYDPVAIVARATAARAAEMRS